MDIYIGFIYVQSSPVAMLHHKYHSAVKAYLCDILNTW